MLTLQTIQQDGIVGKLEKIDLCNLLCSIRGSASPALALLHWLAVRTNDGDDDPTTDAAAAASKKNNPGVDEPGSSMKFLHPAPFVYVAPADLRAEWQRLIFFEGRRARWAVRESNSLRRGLAELEMVKVVKSARWC